MDEARKFPPALMLTQMRQRVSRKGDAFLEGRLGLAKVLLLQSSKLDEDGNPIWNLCVQELPREGTARPAASSPSIFTAAANVAPIAAERRTSTKRNEPAQEPVYEFDDNIDDLFPAGRA